ncbi:MAG: hypothetical protein IJJ69_06745, partial [Oscillospiraceae bacterium]|nr:hypothetical protein [Oscillospiraceae bacterium]
MFEWLLAKKYIIQQKRHSFLTVCSIMTALALITALFTLFSTVFQCLRDIEYDNNPWHYKIVHLTKEKAESLLNLPDFEGETVRDFYGREVPKPAHGSRSLGSETNSSKAIVEALVF